MSVAVLSRNEFINVFAASWCYGSAGSSEAMRRFDRMAEEANALMLANLATYNHAYGETGGRRRRSHFGRRDKICTCADDSAVPKLSV